MSLCAWHTNLLNDYTPCPYMPGLCLLRFFSVVLFFAFFINWSKIYTQKLTIFKGNQNSPHGKTLEFVSKAELGRKVGWEGHGHKCPRLLVGLPAGEQSQHKHDLCCNPYFLRCGEGEDMNGAGVSTLTPLLSSREWSFRKQDLWRGLWLPGQGKPHKGRKGKEATGEGGAEECNVNHPTFCPAKGEGWDLPAKLGGARPSLHIYSTPPHSKNVSGE